MLRYMTGDIVLARTPGTVVEVIYAVATEAFLVKVKEADGEHWYLDEDVKPLHTVRP